MSTKIFYLTGIVKWAKVQKPDEKYNVYTLDLFLDNDSLQKFKASGLQLKMRETEEGDYIKLRRPVEKMIKGEVVTLGPPEVLIKDQMSDTFVPYEGLIGNGSRAVCKVSVYSTMKGMGHTLEVVAVEDLVEYGGIEGDGEFPF